MDPNNRVLGRMGARELTNRKLRMYKVRFKYAAP